LALHSKPLFLRLEPAPRSPRDSYATASFDAVLKEAVTPDSKFVTRHTETVIVARIVSGR